MMLAVFLATAPCAKGALEWLLDIFPGSGCPADKSGARGFKVKRVKIIALVGAALAFAGTVAHAEITSIAGDFTPERQQAWVELARTITSAANSEAESITGYVGGLEVACNGATGKVMDMHAPNSIAIQILGFCMAVGDLEKERKFHVDGNKKSWLSGAPAYCGDFDQGLNFASAMPNTTDYAFIYPAAQDLAAAAKKIKATEFKFIPIYRGVASFLGMDMRPEPRIVKCP